MLIFIVHVYELDKRLHLDQRMAYELGVLEDSDQNCFLRYFFIYFFFKLYYAPIFTNTFTNTDFHKHIHKH